MARWQKPATSRVSPGRLRFREAAARTVAARAQELFEHADGVLDTSDIERVHDMRVATRRLRAVLEIYAPCFPRKAPRGGPRDVKRWPTRSARAATPTSSSSRSAVGGLRRGRPRGREASDRLRSEQRPATRSRRALARAEQDAPARAALAGSPAGAPTSEDEPSLRPEAVAEPSRSRSPRSPSEPPRRSSRSPSGPAAVAEPARSAARRAHGDDAA